MNISGARSHYTAIVEDEAIYYLKADERGEVKRVPPRIF